MASCEFEFSYKLHLAQNFQVCLGTPFGRIVDTSEEYIKIIIVNPNVHYFFLLFM